MKISKQKTIIYIASDLRSGSTLLDRLLSNHPQIQTIGELKNLNYYLNRSPVGPGTTRNWICRCGVQLIKCPFWSKIIDSYQKLETRDMAQLQTEAKLNFKSAIFGLLAGVSMIGTKYFRKKIITKLFHSERNLKIGDNCFKVYDFFSKQTEKRFIIDSSKRPEQLYAIRLALPQDYKLKVIHLVRDGRAVTHSVLKRSAEAGKKNYFLKVLSNWILTNNLIHNLHLFFDKKSFIRIRYEDLCTNTEGTMRKICDTFDLPFDPAMTSITEDQKHNIGGTPRQFDKLTEIRLDERWKAGMPLHQKILFQGLGGLINKTFGY